VCLLAAPCVQLSVSAGNGRPHNALQHHWLMPISCHFRECKALLVTSLTYVSGTIASVQTFTFTSSLLLFSFFNVQVSELYTRTLNIYRGPQKRATWYSFITLIRVDRFLKFFHYQLSSKFTMRLLPYFPPHMQCIATLPCEKQYQKIKILTYLTQYHHFALLLTKLTK